MSATHQCITNEWSSRQAGANIPGSVKSQRHRDGCVTVVPGKFFLTCWRSCWRIIQGIGGPTPHHPPHQKMEYGQICMCRADCGRDRDGWCSLLLLSGGRSASWPFLDCGEPWHLVLICFSVVARLVVSVRGGGWGCLLLVVAAARRMVYVGRWSCFSHSLVFDPSFLDTGGLYLLLPARLLAVGHMILIFECVHSGLGRWMFAVPPALELVVQEPCVRMHNNH